MPTMVYTETICDVCGKTNKEQGAEKYYPPLEWSVLTLDTRVEEPGWANSERMESTLCPACTKAEKESLRKVE